MPSNPIGYSFAPTFENAELAGKTASAKPQDAIQVLSYRLPRTARISGGLSPLMGDSPKGGPNRSVLESVFKTIFGPEQAAAFMGSNGELSSRSTGGSSSGSTGGSSPLPPTKPDDVVILPGGGNSGSAPPAPTPDPPKPPTMPDFSTDPYTYERPLF